MPPIHLAYTVSLPRPHTHEFEILLRIDGWTGSHLDLTMPVWTPGSYKIQDFPRHVVRFEASGLPFKKINKHTWRITSRGQRRIAVRYTVYANELSVRSCHADDTHGYFDGATLFMYLPGKTDLPITVHIRPPRGWKIATALPRTTRPNTFLAADYDTLADSPVEIGTFREASFRVRGRRHSVVVHGDGNYDFPRMVRDLRDIVTAQTRFFGEAPYPHYTFILHPVPQGSGGLEHMNSTSLAYPAYGFTPPEKYEDFLRLVSHEFFHLWNVKRIRPADLIPFDYQKEMYTPLLWVCEGVTSYYEDLLVVRAGLITPKRYLEKLAERIQQYRNKPGRKVQTVAESSFDTWIKHYQPNENSVNAGISYYEKGRLVGLALDMEIRKSSRGRGSLDDVMRALNARFARQDRGYTAEDVLDLCTEFARRDMRPFFKKYVTGLDELDFDAALNAAGLRLEIAPKEKTAKPYLGILTSRSGDRLVIANVLAGTPAYEYGLNSRDELLALDGIKITPDEWEKQLGARKPGQTCAIIVFRNGVLRRIPVRLGGKRELRYSITPVKAASAHQKRTCRTWLEVPLGGGKK